MEALFLILLFVQLMVLWRSCQRQPINVHVYIDARCEDDGDNTSSPLHFEGDEWKDGREGDDATI